MGYQTQQIINALVNEWEYLTHDDYDPNDPTPEQYRKELEEYTYDELIEETCTDDCFTLDQYMETYG